MERPAIPVCAASATLAATPSGSTAWPPSKSALTGTATASATARRWSSTCSSAAPPSGRPTVHANPELVVASAGKPSCSSARALPASHGFGITKQPDSWSRWNSAIRSASTAMATPLSLCWSRTLLAPPPAVADRLGYSLR